MNSKDWAAQKRAYTAGAKIQFRYKDMYGDFSPWLDIDRPEWDDTCQYRVKPGQRRKHYDLIVKWADGDRIQYRDTDGHWYPTPHPAWDDETEYRVETECKPDIVIERYVYTWNHYIEGKQLAWNIAGDPLKKPNARFVFDGETHELKSMEVIQ